WHGRSCLASAVKRASRECELLAGDGQIRDPVGTVGEGRRSMALAESTVSRRRTLHCVLSWNVETHTRSVSVSGASTPRALAMTSERALYGTAIANQNTGRNHRRATYARAAVNSHRAVGSSYLRLSDINQPITRPWPRHDRQPPRLLKIEPKDLWPHARL